MAKMASLGSVYRWFVVAVQFLLLVSACAGQRTSNRNRGGVSGFDQTNDPVKLRVFDRSVVVTNGLVEVTFQNPGGDISGIKYGGLDNFLETHNSQTQRGYLDLVWNWPDQGGIYDKVVATKFKIITQNDDLVELSFFRAWDNSSNIAPLHIDRRYIIRRNVAGIYVYAIFEHPKGWPSFEMAQTRVAYKLNGQTFHYMVISDQRQRIMPLPSDRLKGQTLAFGEAVLLTDPSNPDLKGEVDDKYQYSAETEDSGVHGWISEDPPVGFWMITPSHEFRACGPIKQELTSHVGPVTLGTFMTKHYAGRDADATFGQDEAWKKVFGPIMIYVNKALPQQSASDVWDDAKKRLQIETQSWPYNFTNSVDFPSSGQRGTVSGQLLVRDRYIAKMDIPANSAYIGLANPGEVGSWQTETKGYQFWTRTDRQGRFVIKNVRPGVYDLYGWVPGIVGDYRYNASVTVTSGSQQDLGSIVYEPPRQGPTIWEIGIPDRKAAEFYVPPASPSFPNKLYLDLKDDWFRQYGLWERYTELYPHGDLVYTVGASNYTGDWFFAHVTRNKGNNVYEPTTWRVNFELPDVNPRAIYTVQMALASANAAEVQVRFNDPKMGPAHFTTGLIGWDNAIARHGIHGLYHFYSFAVPGTLLRRGINTMSLTQSRAQSPFQGVMYDYIRLEGPPPPRA